MTGRGGFLERSGSGAAASGGAGGTLPAGTVDGQLLIWDQPTALWVPSVNVLMPDAAALNFQVQEAATSMTFSQVQDTAGAGAAWTLRAQRGFAGSIGGTLTIGGGQGGTLGANLAGSTTIDLGQLVGGASAQLVLSAGASGNIADLGQVTGNFFRIANAAAASAGIFILSSALTQLSAGTALNFVPGTTANWYGPSGLPARVNTFSAAGANTEVWQAGVASITESWTTDATAAGGAWLRVGQGGAPGFAGGMLEFVGGAAGATGTRSTGGDVRCIAGDAGGDSGAGAAGGDVICAPGLPIGPEVPGGEVQLCNSAEVPRVRVSDQGLAFWNVAPTAQSADIVTITDSTGGTATRTLNDVGAAFNQATLNNNFATIADFLNDLRTMLRTIGLMA